MPSRGMDVLTWSSTVWRFILQIRPRVGPGLELRETPSGTIISLAPGKATSALPITTCPFGEITTWQAGGTTKTGIRGGVVYCGDKNLTFDPFEVSLETDTALLIFLNIECTSNMDDDGELILPGIETTSDTPAADWDSSAWSTGTQYPDNNNPTVSSAGVGAIIIPLGKLTVKDGVATFDPVACGNVTVSQCGGILTHSRQ